MNDKEVHEIDLRFEHEPPSVQSRRARKDAFAAYVRAEVQKYDLLIVDDVHLSIDWICRERDRYESDHKADIDNIVKPLFDSLTGPDGLLIDDNQIQSFYCGWLGHNADSDVLSVRIKPVAGESITEISLGRKSLRFVGIGDNLYFPIDDTFPADLRKEMLLHLRDRVAMRDSYRLATGNYFVGQYFMPVQRLFHRSRIVRFPSMSLEEYVAQLSSSSD